ncbi:DUF1934 domain-containing protein [Lactobacillus delbrueckii]|uniref:DUF1934 domain-containing protein n=1 Tax=Lactobacillus delbrueckii TaxID=1584 RepID=A0A4Q7E0U2_9LACO|nr:DUF1934 domain-containing protein [Lactobacillus delbrueckii]MCD5485703.1 DUF1934 domain-containing protein [Lactobacillus delbrueckii subsp. lactis]MCD5488628.1 DUF1934 domain-containing protein [Lactobacillus delbrueckii subsp. lactis]MCD5515152.1 DUF1934 domain-containing protein [Lactobacillus delbrueckii subsp. lactis]MCD5521045.1 DUF1934 domain-containing protein [Lactobacillus delbrueckii subsp. lactis]MCT3485203.1 DUF1934 domain-containing protein [Lactobacillus delbrueckii subsp. l
MSKIKIDLTSKITQGEQTETISQQAEGELREDGAVKRIFYEAEKVPVKMLVKEQELLIRRGTDHSNFSQMHFILGEKGQCKYVVEGRQLDLLSETKRLELKENAAGQQLEVEYDLFSGVDLIGSYAVSLIFA